MPLDALILDVDGTLVDTNPIHVAAFVDGFKQFGYVVAPDRIAPEIGKGGDHLIPDVLGYSAHEKDGDGLKTAIKKQFLDTIANNKVALLPGAVEIIDAAKKRGLKVAIATSGEKEFLEAIENCCGVTFSEMVDVVITSADAKESKPSPDIVSAASQKLGLTPAQCAMVGDTPHDARACRAAGVVCFGLETGGHEGADLREAGCRRVYADCAEIAANFDEFLQIAAPVRARLTQEVLENLMREALQTARQGMEAGEAPIGERFGRRRRRNHRARLEFDERDPKQNRARRNGGVCRCRRKSGARCQGFDPNFNSGTVRDVPGRGDGSGRRCRGLRARSALRWRHASRLGAAQSRKFDAAHRGAGFGKGIARAVWEWLDNNRDSEQAAYIKQLLGEEKEAEKGA